MHKLSGKINRRTSNGDTPSWSSILQNIEERSELLNQLKMQACKILHKKFDYDVEIIYKNIDVSEIERGNISASLSLYRRHLGLLWGVGDGQFIFNNGCLNFIIIV